MIWVANNLPHAVKSLFLLDKAHTVLIDIHNHKPPIVQHSVMQFSLPNCIIGEDTMPASGYCSVGIHPAFLASDLQEQYVVLEQLARKKHVLAIGECGLDKRYPESWQRQTSIFIRQIALAKQLDKALIIHSVRAYGEIMAILGQQKAAPGKVIFHGFVKNYALAKSLLDKGYYLSLGAQLLKGGMDDLIKRIPIDQIFLETDDKPVEILEIYTYFCRVRNLPIEVLEEQLMLNLQQVFNPQVL